MSMETDLQNFTRRFWRGASNALHAGGEILEIVEVEGIADMSGFTVNSVRVFSGRDDFPSPVARMKRKLFWRKDDISNWIKSRITAGRT